MRGLRDDLKLALDPVEFARHVGMRPERWQADLLSTPSNRVILNCSRQAGKSSFSAILALHRALYFPKSLVLVFAPALRQSQEFFQKLDAFWRAAGLPGEADSERKLGLELKNGSRVEALPGSEKTTRGFSAPSLIIFEEASRIDDSLYFDGARPMIATVPDSTLLLISSPYGRRGFFYEEWEHGGPGWERFRITADDSEAVKSEYIEEERRIKSERQIAQEYYCEFTEADGAVFGGNLIDHAFDDDEVLPLWQD
ncbi:MAG: terminase family protein [Actinomycetota bacterium]|nr:terminase family protein [Actinomycetota bacterium]